MYAACVIGSAVRWQIHAELCSRWLRLAGDTMSHSDRLAYSRESARASSERDRHLRLLGLDRQNQDDIFDELYASPAAPSADGNGDEDTKATSDETASEAAPGDDGRRR